MTIHTTNATNTMNAPLLGSQARKPIAVAAYRGQYENTTVIAVCDDGTIWQTPRVSQDHPEAPYWEPLPPIPQPTSAKLPPASLYTFHDML